MRERPILFSGPMVRAILDGRKTQTRRVVKGVPSGDHYGRDIMDWGLSGIHQDGYGEHDQLGGTDRWYLDVQTDVDDHSRRIIRCPYGAHGDRLWVREAWACLGKPRPGDPLVYRADVADGERVRVDAPWRPSIHMPRWASRITLRITDVRVERLQDISEADCVAEGCPAPDADWCPAGPSDERALSARCAYEALWEHINGPGSWDANPWVWAVSFERVAA